MIWIVLVDRNLNLLRPHGIIRNQNFFTVCKTAAKRMISCLTVSLKDSYVSVVQSESLYGSPNLVPFSNNPAALHLAVDQLMEPTPMKLQNLEQLVLWTVTEVFKYWGPSEIIHILFFTDGDVSQFLSSGLVSMHSQCKPLDHAVANSWLTIISLSDGQVAPEVLQLHHQFYPRSTILTWDQYQTCKNSNGPSIEDEFEGFIEYCTRACLSRHGFDRQYEISLRCGHLKCLVQLTPVLRIRDNESPDLLKSLHLEIFGFLHASDLSNPPVASRHRVNTSSRETGSVFLHLLLSALQETKTVAMCSIYASTDSGGRSHDGPPLQHGFVHQFDPKSTILMLSVFSRDCTGLPWLGQFQHLAPVEDFAGVQLYDDREGSSPFPVLVPDRLSYATLSESGSSLNRVSNTGEPFRYVSWVSPTSMLSEVNKVLRLGRRLPDKSTMFFKELTRLRSAALAYGCPELLTQVARLTELAHQTADNQVPSDAVRIHLNTMNRMLSEVTNEVDS